MVEIITFRDSDIVSYLKIYLNLSGTVWSNFRRAIL